MALGVVGDVSFTVAESVHTLTITIPVQDEPEWEVDDAVLSLADDTECYRIALASGHFVAVEGFELDDSETVATPIPVDEDDTSEPIELVLSWTVGG
jgi:hypothetical protein